jgi:ribonucleoside-diphosphate reductase alpha chain
VVKNPHLLKLLQEKSKDSNNVWNTILEKGGSVQHLDFLSAEEKDTYKTSFEIDQRWLIEHAGDRTPYVCQAQSLNVFLPANVHKADLPRIHWEAWQKGVKSLYYCRSKSIQRAESDASWKRTQALEPKDNREPELTDNNYEECLACQ